MAAKSDTTERMKNGIASPNAADAMGSIVVVTTTPSQLAAEPKPIPNFRVLSANISAATVNTVDAQHMPNANINKTTLTSAKGLYCLPNSGSVVGAKKH